MTKQTKAKWFHETSDKYGPQFLGMHENDEERPLASLVPVYGVAQRTDGNRPPMEWSIVVLRDRCGTARTLREAKAIVKAKLAEVHRNAERKAKPVESKPESNVGVIARSFPAEFGLRAHAGTFRVNVAASYRNDAGEIMIVTQRLCSTRTGEQWQDFGKGTAAELRAEIVETMHPDGTPMDEQDIEHSRERARNGIKRDEQRARYVAQYPESKHRLLYSGVTSRAWPLCGVEELRMAVEWANSEPEDNHEWQTAEDILNAYRKACAEDR